MQKKRLIILSFFISIFILLGKLGTYFYTGSNIILTDALENIINVVASGFAWYSLYLSSLPKDANHPYGHGKVEFFAAGFEGGLVMIAGLLMVLKSGFNFFVPNETTHLELGAVVMGVSSGVYFLMGWSLLREAKRQQSIVLEAEGNHLMADIITTLIGMSGVLLVHVTGFQHLDSVFSLVLSLFIMWNGYRIVRPSIAGLMDETDMKMIYSVQGILEKHRKADWIDVHNLRVQKYGSDIHVDCHVTIPFYYRLKESHDIVHELEIRLSEEYSQGVEIFIHADPCVPEINCKICGVEDCAYRQAPFAGRLAWTPERLMKNEKHRLDGGMDGGG